jgi:pyruvate dehydrogenase (quinone)/pyruvate decarboxylase
MPGPNSFDRRDFISVAATGLALAGVGTMVRAATPPAETQSAISPQPMPEFGNDLNTADILIETLIAWGATHAFGIVGDGINSVIEALRKRSDRIRYVGVRHEEAAAFMASGFAKHTGRLGVCIGTTGPGAIHLLNGLYDAALDGAPVVALTGLTFHDLTGVRYSRASTR